MFALVFYKDREIEEIFTKLFRVLDDPVHEAGVVGVHEPRRVVVLRFEGFDLCPEQGVVVIGQAVVALEAAGLIEAGRACGVAEERQEDREAAGREDVRDDDVNGAERNQFLRKKCTGTYR